MKNIEHTDRTDDEKQTTTESIYIMKRSVQKRDPAGRIQPSQGDEPMKRSASTNSNRQRIQIEDEKFIIIIVGVVLYLLIIGGVI